MGISLGLHGLALAGIIEGVRGADVGPKGEIELHLVHGEKPPERKVLAPEGPPTRRPRPPRAATGRRRRLPKKHTLRRVRPQRSEPGRHEALAVAPAPASLPAPLSQPAPGAVADPTLAPPAQPAPRPSVPRVATPKAGPTQGARLLSDEPRPAYPRLARMRREEGVAHLRLQIRSDGQVGEVELAKSSGSVLLDGAASRAVRRWRFAPALERGRAVSAWVRVPVRFELRR